MAGEKSNIKKQHKINTKTGFTIPVFNFETETIIS